MVHDGLQVRGPASRVEAGARDGQRERDKTLYSHCRGERGNNKRTTNFKIILHYAAPQTPLYPPSEHRNKCCTSVEALCLVLSDLTFPRPLARSLGAASYLAQINRQTMAHS